MMGRPACTLWVLLALLPAAGGSWGHAGVRGHGRTRGSRFSADALLGLNGQERFLELTTARARRTSASPGPAPAEDDDDHSQYLQHLTIGTAASLANVVKEGRAVAAYRYLRHVSSDQATVPTGTHELSLWMMLSRPHGADPHVNLTHHMAAPWSCPARPTCLVSSCAARGAGPGS